MAEGTYIRMGAGGGGIVRSPTGSTRSGDSLSTSHAAVPFTRDKCAQLNIRTVRIVFVIAGANPALAVPAVERRVFGAVQFGFELFERFICITDVLPHLRRIRRSKG